MAIFSTSEAKARELARLSNLFNRLAAWQLGGSAPSNSGIHLPMPDEFTSVLQNLSSIVNNQTPMYPATHRPRRNTMAILPCDTSHDSYSRDDVSNGPTSPEPFLLTNEEEYPFTFKHMIHKLYKKDVWAQTVKEVLERSKKDFKPLADKDSQKPQVRIDHDTQNTSRRKSAMMPPGLGTAKRTSFLAKGNGSRRLSQAVKHDVRAPLSPITPKDPFTSSHQAPTNGESIRALKKRCVGIRKSVSGIPNIYLGGNVKPEDSGKKGGSFVYASSVSSTEGPGEETYICFPPSSPISPSEFSLSSSGYESFCYEHKSSIPSTPTSPRMDQFSVRLKRRVGLDNQVVTVKSLPSQKSKGVEKVMAWRYSLMEDTV
jgi:hypothetical protein